MTEKRTPSPWGEQNQPGGIKVEYAFALDSFPPNSYPFIDRLREVLDKSYTNSLQTLAEGRAMEDTSREEGGWRARALLWVLNAQYFGQAANIDMFQEWQELNKAREAGKF